jgi:hypothetical protein
MKIAAEELYNFLMGRTEFTDVLGNKLFPIVAFEDNEYPLATYRVIQEPMSKDSDKYTFILNVCFTSWIDALEFTDSIVEVLKEQYDYSSSTVDWNEDLKIYIGIINFEK